MKATTFSMKDAEGVDVFVRRWEPDSGAPSAAVQIAHGVSEHSGRYAALAERLCSSGYACYANDHRGHGLTAPATGGLGRLGPGGWDAVVRDLALLSDRIRSDHPGIPLFMAGHSWGSHLAQDYIQRWGSGLAGAALIGSTGSQTASVTLFGPILARLMILFKGPDATNNLADKLVFDGYNKPFLAPGVSKSAWISRDPAEVKAFDDDPDCGFPFSTGMSLEMALAYRRIWREESERRIPKDLPVYIASGTEDSSNARLVDLKPLVERYRTRLGLSDLTVKYYEGARHCLIHETNRDEVIDDLVAWL
ncbi:MAG: alpha/beta fold hydrolase, partial [Spirochaetales bacterium]